MYVSKAVGVYQFIGIVGFVCAAQHSAAGEPDQAVASSTSSATSSATSAPESAEDGVRVVVNSKRPAFLYEHGLDAGGKRSWVARCSKPPCEATVRPYELYFVGGPRISSSAPFHLPPQAQAVTLEVRAGSIAVRRVGIGLMVLGGFGAAAFTVTGAIATKHWLGDNLCNLFTSDSPPRACPTSDTTRNFGIAAIGALSGSVAMLIIGGILHRINYRSMIHMKVEISRGIILTSRGLLF